MLPKLIDPSEKSAGSQNLTQHNSEATSEDSMRETTSKSSETQSATYGSVGSLINHSTDSPPQHHNHKTAFHDVTQLTEPTNGSMET